MRVNIGACMSWLLLAMMLDLGICVGANDAGLESDANHDAVAVPVPSPINHRQLPASTFTPGSGGDEARRRRRRLNASGGTLLKEKDDSFHALLQQCGTVDYDVFLFVDVDTHLYLAFLPNGDNTAYDATPNKKNCPPGATHAVMSKSDHPPYKEIFTWPDPESHASMFPPADRLHVGTFPLSDMARAYAKASPGRVFAEKKGVAAYSSLSKDYYFYHLVTNNCAVYLWNLAQEIGVTVDARITSFVTRRLLEQSGRMVGDLVRHQKDIMSLLFGGSARRLGAGPSDMEVVEKLVEMGHSFIAAQQVDVNGDVLP